MSCSKSSKATDAGMDDTESVYLSPFSSPPLRMYKDAPSSSFGPPRSRNASRNCSPSSAQLLSASKEFDKGIPTEWDGWSLFYSDEGYPYYYHHESKDWHWAPTDVDDVDTDYYGGDNCPTGEGGSGIASCVKECDDDTVRVSTTADGHAIGMTGISGLSTDLLKSFSQTLNESQNYSDTSTSTNDSSVTACQSASEGFSKGNEKENMLNAIARTPSCKPPLSPQRNNHKAAKSKMRTKKELSKANCDVIASTVNDSVKTKKPSEVAKVKTLQKAEPPTVKESDSPGFTAFQEYMKTEPKACIGDCSVNSVHEQLSSLDMSKIIDSDRSVRMSLSLSMINKSNITDVAAAATTDVESNPVINKSTDTVPEVDNSIVINTTGVNEDPDILFPELEYSNQSVSVSVSVVEESDVPEASAYVGSSTAVTADSNVSKVESMGVIPPQDVNIETTVLLETELRACLEVDFPGVGASPVINDLLKGVDVSPEGYMSPPKSPIDAQSEQELLLSPSVSIVNSIISPLTIKYTDDGIDDSMLINDEERSVNCSNVSNDSVSVYSPAKTDISVSITEELVPTVAAAGGGNVADVSLTNDVDHSEYADKPTAKTRNTISKPSVFSLWFSSMATFVDGICSQHSISSQNLLLFGGMLGVATTTAVIYVNMHYKKGK